MTSNLAKMKLEDEDDDDSPIDPLSKVSRTNRKAKKNLRGSFFFQQIQPELAELFVYLQNVPYKENFEAKRKCKSIRTRLNPIVKLFRFAVPFDIVGRRSFFENFGKNVDRYRFSNDLASFSNLSRRNSSRFE